MTFDSRWKNPQGADPKQLHLWAQDLIKELRKGAYLAGVSEADGIGYDNTTSGLTADTVQEAIDENDGRLDALEAAPAGLVLLNSGVVTSQATLDIPLTSFTAYRALKLVLSSFLPVTDDVELWLRFSTDGGANYDAGAGAYSYALIGDQAGTATAILDMQNAAATQILVAGRAAVTGSVSNVTAEGGVDTEITLHGRTDAARLTRARISSAYNIANNAAMLSSNGAGQRLTAQDTDAVRVLFESGNIASGDWALYGYA